MKLVIEIDEEMYNMACKYPEMVLAGYPLCIKNGTPQEPCEDVVSRQAVNELVDELARAISDERCCISRGRSTATIMRDIRHLPSITAQPKMGKWEKRDVRGQRVDCCSVCGLSNGTIYEYNYCPNCGAKMQEVEE